METAVNRLIELMEAAAAGNYSDDDVLEFTKSGHAENIQRIAEAFGMMMVNIRIRETHLEKLNEELSQFNSLLRKNTLQTVMAIAHSVGARDVYTEGHGHRVARYTTRLARDLGLDDAEIVNIRMAAYLHDIGKIGFSDTVFANRAGQPSPEIMEEIKLHPALGVEILKNLDFLKPALEYILYHHERADGSGYPEGRKGSDIPLGARIISVADTFDALTTDRTYQQGRTRAEAFEILRGLCPDKLDSRLVETFIAGVESEQ